jgi:hypothetical protein
MISFVAAQIVVPLKREPFPIRNSAPGLRVRNTTGCPTPRAVWREREQIRQLSPTTIAESGAKLMIGIPSQMMPWPSWAP